MADEVIVLNVDQVLAALASIDDLARQELELASRATLLSLIPLLASYPAPRGSYRRTGTLGRQWSASNPTFAVTRAGFTATLGNPTPYAPYVQGRPGAKPGQARMHRGRWATVKDAERQGQPLADGEVAAAMARIAARITQVTG